MAFRYKGVCLWLFIYLDYCVALIDLHLFLCTKVDFNMCEYFGAFLCAPIHISFTRVCTLCCAAGDEIYSNDSVHYYRYVRPSLRTICISAPVVCVLKERRPKHAFVYKYILNETFSIHLHLHYSLYLFSVDVGVHTFFGTLMMPLNLYSLFPVALFVLGTHQHTHAHTQGYTHSYSVSLYISVFVRTSI